ncbi:MAG TPA: mannonate dehydratase [Chthonomonadaceae bacterium]|nr:mannonate dehydratase [Chthonomonadaceae bacterium]
MKAIDLNALSMRIAVGQINELTDEHLAFARQVGAEDIQMNTPKLPGDHRWELADLEELRRRAESHGLRLIALENVPVRFYDKIMLGQPGRDEQMAHMAATVRNMGAAGIPILGYHWMPNGVWRTSRETLLRGGAVSNEFHYDEVRTTAPTHGRDFSAAEMWESYDWYLSRILPVCEEAGVRLALHPDDPPVPALGGVARIFGTFEGFRRAMETHPSPMHGLDFCHGCWSEMRAGAGVLDAIEWFGSRGRIFYMHLRDVQGGAEDFQECFVDEGNCSVPAAVRKLREVGFNGFILDDHVPRLVNDSPYGHRGRAYAIGYIRGLLAATAAA